MSCKGKGDIANMLVRLKVHSDHCHGLCCWDFDIQVLRTQLIFPEGSDIVIAPTLLEELSDLNQTSFLLHPGTKQVIGCKEAKALAEII